MAKKRKKKTDLGTIVFRAIAIELLVLTVVLIAIGAKFAPMVMSILDSGSSAIQTENPQTPDPAATSGAEIAQGPVETSAQTEPTTEEPVVTTISYENEVEQGSVALVAAGDNLMYSSNTLSGKRDDGTYSYYDNFVNVKDYFLNADLAVLSQDTVMAGNHYGVTYNGVFTTGTEIGADMVSAGINVVLAANNHILDCGTDGLNNMMNYWESTYPEVSLLGVNRSADQQNAPVYVEKNGIKIAMINYTCKSNSTQDLAAAPYLVNMYDEQWLTSVITAAEASADFVIVFPHWGTENELGVTAEQEAQAQLMADLGADLIIGAYPNVVEPVRWVEGKDGNKTLVYYSLGNFQSAQEKTENMLGALAQVTITKTDMRTYISDCDIEFLVTHYGQEKTNEYFDIVTTFPLDDYNDELAGQHGLYL